MSTKNSKHDARMRCQMNVALVPIQLMLRAISRAMSGVHRIFIRPAGWSATLPACLMLGVLLLWSQPGECGLGFVAYLKNVKPTVEVSAKGANRFRGARERTTLTAGAIVRAKMPGKANVMFTNGTKVALHGKNPLLQIVKEETRSSPLVLRVLTAGKFWVRERGNTHVDTAAAIAAANATEYHLEVLENDPKTTVLTVIEGTVKFSNPQGVVSVPAGHESTARVGQKPTDPTRVTDVSGVIQWTADITGLPVELELPFVSSDPSILRTLRREREAAIHASANSAAAHQRFGEVLHDLGEYSKSVEEFQKAVELAPQSAMALFGLGRAKQGQGDVPGALQAYSQAQSLSPDDTQLSTRLRLCQALAYLAGHDQDRPDQAGQEQAQRSRQQAREVLAPISDNALARTILGLVELREGHVPQAVQHLEAAVKQEPPLYQAHALLALAYLSQNQAPEALKVAQRAAELQPNSAQAQGTLSMARFFAGQPKEAARAAGRAVELNPYSPFALLTQARVFLSQLRTDDARFVYQQAVALAPSLWIVHVELGHVYLRLDMLPKAERAYRRALELNSNSPDAYTGLGVALYRQGREKEALAAYDKALQLASRSAPARANLAELFIWQGQFERARQELEQGAIDQPEYGILYVRLAELSLYRQNLFAAQEFARHAVQLLPNSAIARYQLGRVYLEQGRAVQAEQQFRQAVTLDPQFTAARYALGFTRELTQRGLFSASFLSSPATLGSSGTGPSLQNLQTPGAEERIQAALEDPTVVRVASRSYGDTQLGTTIGEYDTRNLDVSHLQTTDNRRGVRGIIAETQRATGVRDNADRAFDRFAVVLGQKAKTNPSGVLFLGEWEQEELGLDTGVASDFGERTRRQNYRTPRLLAGFNLQTSERSRTRVLMQGSRPKLELRDSSEFGSQEEFDFRSLNVEARHDRQLGSKHLLSAGIFLGKRSREIESNSSIFRSIINAQVRASGVYLRDQVRVSDRLTVAGEMQVQNLEFTNSRQLLVPGPTKKLNDENITVGLPKLIIAYQPNTRSGLRLRVRRLSGAPRDFQLLSPTDVFSELEGLPEAILFSPNTNIDNKTFGQGTSIELEYDYTFRDTSFLRIGLFRQRLQAAEIPRESTGTYAKVRQQGARISYEGLLGRNTAYFTRIYLNRAEDIALGQDIAQVPDFAAEMGMQFLNRKGYFVQPLFFYQGNRLNKQGSARRMGGSGVFNVRAGKRWGLRSTVFIELNNVFNKEYTLIRDLQLGRQLRVGLTQRF